MLTPLQAGGQLSAVFVTVLALVFMAFVALLIVRNRWNRPDMDPEHAAIILSQLHSFGGGKGAVVFGSRDDITDPEKLDDVRSMFEGKPRENEPTTRSAFLEIAGEVREELASRSPDTSSITSRAVQEALLTALFGALAIVPVAAWREAATSGGQSVPTATDILASGSLVAEALVSVALSYPYTAEIFAVTLSLGVIGAKTAWTLWFAPPIALVTLAILHVVLERRVDHDVDPSGPSAKAWTTRFVSLVAIWWFVGASLATVGNALPGGIGVRATTATVAALAGAGVTLYLTRPRGEHLRDANWKQSVVVAGLFAGLSHSIVAIIVSFTIVASVSSVWARRTLRRWRFVARERGRESLALTIVHSLTVFASAATLPLLAGYAIAAVWTGKAAQVAGVVLSAPDGTVIAVLALVAVTAIATLVVFADRFHDVRRGIRRALSVKAVRAAVITKAFPAATTGIAAVFMLAMGISPVAAVAAALGLGIAARMVTMGYNYVSYRYHARQSGDDGAGRVVVNGQQVHDNDDDPIYVASVNGHRTAHRDIDPLVEQIKRDADRLFGEGQPEHGSFPRYYYENGIRHGNPDIEHIRNQLTGDVRTRLEANVRQTDAEADDILEKLHENYPSQVVENTVKSLMKRNRLRRQGDQFEWNERAR